MERNNIKHLAIAAFRFYAHNKGSLPKDEEDVLTIAAVASTLRHLEIEGRQLTLDVIKRVCFDLPPGNLPRGTITSRVSRAAYELNTSDSCAWRELRRACSLLDEYHKAFTPKS